MNFDQSKSTYLARKNIFTNRIKERALGDEICFNRAKGAWLYDLDGNELIDFYSTNGALIAGHAHPDLRAALEEIINLGLSAGTPTELEFILGKMILNLFPGLDLLNLVSSGAEAILTALKLAKLSTNRKYLVLMQGADDHYLNYNSAFWPLDKLENESCIIKVPFNDLENLITLFAEKGEEIAAVLLEPIFTKGLILPREGYLRGVRELTEQFGTLLIFDERMSGLRIGQGGAQEYYQIAPDLTCFGESLAAGQSIGVLGGKREYMQKEEYGLRNFSPNPITLATAITLLQLLDKPGAYDHLWLLGKRLEDGVKEHLNEFDLKASFKRFGSIFSLQFTDEQVIDYQDLLTVDFALSKSYFQGMLNKNIYLSPVWLHPNFLSLAHTDSEIAQYLEANYQVFQKIFTKNK